MSSITFYAGWPPDGRTAGALRLGYLSIILYMQSVPTGPKVRESSLVSGRWSESTNTLSGGTAHRPSGTDNPVPQWSRPAFPSIRTSPPSMVTVSPPIPTTRLTIQNPPRTGCGKATMLPRRMDSARWASRPMKRAPSPRAGLIEAPETANRLRRSLLIIAILATTGFLLPPERS